MEAEPQIVVSALRDGRETSPCQVGFGDRDYDDHHDHDHDDHDSDLDDDDHDGDGLPAYSHHDKIPPWWGNVSLLMMIKVGMCQCQIPNIHNKLQQLALVGCSTCRQC